MAVKNAIILSLPSFMHVFDFRFLPLLPSTGQVGLTHCLFPPHVLSRPHCCWFNLWPYLLWGARSSLVLTRSPGCLFLVSPLRSSWEAANSLPGFRFYFPSHHSPGVLNPRRRGRERVPLTWQITILLLPSSPPPTFSPSSVCLSSTPEGTVYLLTGQMRLQALRI